MQALEIHCTLAKVSRFCGVQPLHEGCSSSPMCTPSFGYWILRGVLLGRRMEAGPEVLSWQLLEPQLLFILVNYQDYQFAGTLMLEAR